MQSDAGSLDGLHDGAYGDETSIDHEGHGLHYDGGHQLKLLGIEQLFGARDGVESRQSARSVEAACGV